MVSVEVSVIILIVVTSGLLPLMQDGGPFPFDVITIIQHLYPPSVLRSRLSCTLWPAEAAFSSTLLLTPLEQVML